MFGALADFAPDLGALHWLSVDTLPEGEERLWKSPASARDDLAFLQYTSGSTGDPKGVLVTHQNILSNLRLIKEATGVSKERDTVVSWLPLFHDMGLIGKVLCVLYIGTSTTLMSPLAFLKKPLRWLRAISHYRGTASGGPDFAYDLCARKATPEDVASLDLRSWRIALSGAERVRAATLEKFSRVFRDAGFSPRAFYPC